MKRTILLFTALISLTLFAQDEFENETIVDTFNSDEFNRGENVARVTFTDKHVYLRRELEKEEEPLLRNMPVVSGDYLDSRGDAYSEVEFLDGSLLQIANHTSIEFQAINELFNSESLTVIKLYDGSLFLHTTERIEDLNRRVFRIDSEAGSVYVEAPGIYRVDMEGNRMRLRVYRGFAELAGEDESRAVYSGESATIRDMQSPSRARPFNSFRGDRFERWAYERRPASGVSAKYVDESIAHYSRDLDGNGSWRYESSVGRHVWVPYVDNGWAPYRQGYWTNCGPYMSWVSYDPFGYITHHYGRWMFSATFGWYWIPGYYYSPAWVAWSSYDSYIGWCPLGYNDRPYYYSSFAGVHFRRHRTEVVVRTYWNYVPSIEIVNRRRSYNTHTVVLNSPRRITTRRLYVGREWVKEPTRLTRVVSDPVVNRRHDTRVGGTLLQPTRGSYNTASVSNSRGSSTSRYVKIESRSTGTRAVSRMSATATRQRDNTTTRTIVRTATPERRGNTQRTFVDAADSRGNAAGASRGGNDRVTNARDRSGSTVKTRTTQTTRQTTTPTRNSNSQATGSSRGGTTNRTYVPPTRNSSSRATSSSDKGGKSTQSYSPPKRNSTSGQSYKPPSRNSSSSGSSYTPPSRNNSSSGGKSYTPPARSSSGGKTYSKPSRSSSGHSTRSNTSRTRTTTRSTNNRSSNNRGNN